MARFESKAELLKSDQQFHMQKQVSHSPTQARPSIHQAGDLRLRSRTV